ncbi:pyridoxamine 5'-phosphate oxidase family protein [Brassicibacter mesophilus]|uniref:pyridoxamine 5'-phosphate oxidase family protein n=1 Tax=Brassicibacter mesophilus TaxID=745119 RepID=UPI003D1F1D1B
MNKKMNPDQLRMHVREFLSEHKEATIATSMNNLPRCSPVQYFLGNDLDVYIISAGGDKFANIRDNPNVCMLVNTEYINYRQIKGVQIFGHATTSINKPDIKEEAKRYCPDAHLVEYEEDSLYFIKIVPEKIIYLNSLGDGNRTKQVLYQNEIIEKPDKVMSIH